MREALLFFGSFCHKRNRGVGQSPTTPCEARRLRTECGKRKKALKGCGGKQEFSPTATSPLKINFPQKQSSGLFLNRNSKSYKSAQHCSFKTVHRTVLKGDSYRFVVLLGGKLLFSPLFPPLALFYEGFRRLRTATRAPPLTCKGTRPLDPD